MACDIPYLLRRAETEAVRAIACDSDSVAAVHQEMCLLYTGRAIAGLLAAAFDRARRGSLTGSADAPDPGEEALPA